MAMSYVMPLMKQVKDAHRSHNNLRIAGTTCIVRTGAIYYHIRANKGLNE